MRGRAWITALALFAGECSPESPATEGTLAPADPIAPLRAFEADRHARADLAHLPTSDTTTGANPYAIAPLPGGDRAVALLRGRDAIVLLDASARELARAPAPRSPTGLALGGDGRIFVSGEAEATIARYRVRGDAIVREGGVDVPDALAIRDVAWGPEGVLHVVEEHDGRLLTVSADGPAGSPAEALRCGGPVKVARVGDRVIVDCLLDHTLVIRRVDTAGRPVAEGEQRIRHDGPIWSFEVALGADGELVVAAGGVEDHPLDRSIGSFGYIDSFLFLYRVPREGPPLRVAEVNLSALGVVTPKALRVAEADGEIVVTATGYGGEVMAELAFVEGAPPRVATRALAPGTTAWATLASGASIFADPLLDAWLVAARGGAAAVVPVADSAPARSPGARLGEALVFTTIMAPWASSEGPLSRFTCETCHFEGYVDGRTHHTGRGDVRATTKPLLGLFNNRPHFSRALDPDLSSVAENEFDVAGANSGHDTHFTLDPAAHPWLGAIGLDRPAGPEELRLAFMEFLSGFAHRPSPKAALRSTFTTDERRGAALFRDRCEACHEARLAADEPASRVPFEGWEALVLAPEGALVWGTARYAKTGVEPYVHEQGARVPSLRRLYKKQPYLTNGSARDLRSLLARAGFRGDGFRHAGAGEGWERLTGADIDDLTAFLDLL
jgi:hypothetical protein